MPKNVCEMAAIFSRDRWVNIFGNIWWPIHNYMSPGIFQSHRNTFKFARFCRSIFLPCGFTDEPGEEMFHVVIGDVYNELSPSRHHFPWSTHMRRPTTRMGGRARVCVSLNRNVIIMTALSSMGALKVFNLIVSNAFNDENAATMTIFLFIVCEFQLRPTFYLHVKRKVVMLTKFFSLAAPEVVQPETKNSLMWRHFSLSFCSYCDVCIPCLYRTALYRECRVCVSIVACRHSSTACASATILHEFGPIIRTARGSKLSLGRHVGFCGGDAVYPLIKRFSHLQFSDLGVWDLIIP